MKKKEVLSFFFQLDGIALGKGYSSKDLTPTQRQVLQDLKELGLVYHRKSSSKRFYPTRLAFVISAAADSWQSIEGPNSTSTSSNTANSATIEATTSSGGLIGTGGYIIVEANYRAYAYTDQELWVNILNLFMSLKYRMPNMAAYLITRQSIREALMKGITADQMIQFLEQHAHPENKKRTPILPDTLVDQLRLWEKERKRITFDKGYLFDAFGEGQLADHLFLQVEKFSKENNYFVWSQPAQKRLFVTTEGYEPIRKFIREESKKTFD